MKVMARYGGERRRIPTTARGAPQDAPRKRQAKQSAAGPRGLTTLPNDPKAVGPRRDQGLGRLTSYYKSICRCPHPMDPPPTLPSQPIPYSLRYVWLPHIILNEIMKRQMTAGVNDEKSQCYSLHTFQIQFLSLQSPESIPRPALRHDLLAASGSQGAARNTQNAAKAYSRGARLTSPSVSRLALYLRHCDKNLRRVGEPNPRKIEFL